MDISGRRAPLGQRDDRKPEYNSGEILEDDLAAPGPARTSLARGEGLVLGGVRTLVRHGVALLTSPCGGLVLRYWNYTGLSALGRDGRSLSWSLLDRLV